MCTNNIIIEGLWLSGKTTTAKIFSQKYHYKFIPEPSHLEAKNPNIQNLQKWYKKEHLKKEKLLTSINSPWILERSILSVYAFEYALKKQLPSKHEMLRIKNKFKNNNALIVYLANNNKTTKAAIPKKYSTQIKHILINKAAMNRYHTFYTELLPWCYGITPLVFDGINQRKKRDGKLIASEIKKAIDKQRIGQINLIYIKKMAQRKSLQVLILHRTPTRGNFWQAITGGIKPLETLEEACKREAWEETQIRISPKDLISTNFTHSFMGNDGYVLREYVYAAFLRKKDEIHRSEEHDAMEWVSLRLAKKRMFYDNNRKAIDSAVKIVKKKLKIELKI